jgi:hypothetical protein
MKSFRSVLISRPASADLRPAVKLPCKRPGFICDDEVGQPCQAELSGNRFDVGLVESGPGRDASSKFLEGILYAALLASSQ